MTITRISRMRRWLKGQMLQRVHGMITCAEFEDFILRYLEGELTDKQRTVFEWHLRLCRECREYLAAYQRALEVAKVELSEPKAWAGDDVPEDLIKAILEARGA